MKINQLKLGVVLSYALILLNTSIGLLMTPFIVGKVGQSQYGLYELVGAFIGYISILDFGLGNAIVRWVSRYRQENDKKSESNFLAIVFRLYCIFSVLALICGIVLYLNIDTIFSSSLTSSEISQIRIMFIILFINLIITLPSYTFTSSLDAYEQFAFSRTFSILRVLTRSICIVFLLSNGHGIISIVILDTILNIFLVLINIFLCKTVINIKIKLYDFDKHLLKEIFDYSFFIFLNGVLNQLLWKSVPTIIGIRLSTSDVAIYSMGMQFSQIFMLFSTAISGVFFPSVTKMVNNNATVDELTDFMIKIGRMQSLVILYIFSAFLLFGKQFIYLWLGEGYELSYVCAIIVMIGLMIPLVQNIGFSILQALNKHKIYVLLSLLTFVLSSVIAYMLIPQFGIVCGALLMSIGLIVGPGIIINYYYHAYLKLNIIKFFKHIISGALRLLFPSVLISFLVLKFIPINSWYVFLINAVLFTVFYCICFIFWGSTNDEKNYIKNVFMKKYLK